LQLYLQRAWEQYSADQWHALPLEYVPVYQRAIENFARAVQFKQPAPIDGKAARQVLSVVLAIYQSAAERRTISIV